eukprot:EG_transcript_7537
MPCKVLFENARLRIEDFTLAPHEFVAVVHERPCVRWQAGEGHHRLEKDGTVEEVAVLDKQVFFTPEGSTWRLENTGTQEYRQILFHFLQKKPLYSEEEIKSLLAAAIFPPIVGTALLFENEWCRVWDFSLASGEGDPADIHQHVMDYAFLYVGKGHPHKLVGTNPDGSIAFESEAYDGQVQWFHIPNGGFEPDGKTVLQEARHGGFNGNEFQFTEYLVELK